MCRSVYLGPAVAMRGTITSHAPYQARYTWIMRIRTVKIVQIHIMINMMVAMIILGDGYEQERGELLKPRRGIFPTGGPRGSQEPGHCRVSYFLNHRHRNRHQCHHNHPQLGEHQAKPSSLHFSRLCSCLLCSLEGRQVHWKGGLCFHFFVVLLFSCLVV